MFGLNLDSTRHALIPTLANILNEVIAISSQSRNQGMSYAIKILTKHKDFSK